MATYSLKKIVILFAFILLCCSSYSQQNEYYQKAAVILKKQVLEEADKDLFEKPITVTAQSSLRSAGGKHDYFSEGDYWWPNPVNIDSPYIQKDGLTNPENFTASRLALIRFSKIVGALACAYQLTHNHKYAAAAMQHCNAWFIDTATLMNPNLLYAQAIKNKVTGRGIGVIDGIQLMEVVQGLTVIQSAQNVDTAKLSAIKRWFKNYLGWVTTHPYGKDEMNAINNHGTCWVMQVACFSKFVGDEQLMRFCSDRFKTILLPNQLAQDGSFPLEIKRTKPYGYSIFNLDAMVTICQILSTKKDNLFTYKTNDGKTIKTAISFLEPYVSNKSSWPFAQDVMYWNDWPVAQPFLLFGANAFENNRWFNTWSTLNHQSSVEEIIRNLPVRNPLIWF